MPQSIHLDSTHIVKFGHGQKIIIGLHGWAGAYTDLNVFGQWLDPEKYTLYAIELPGRGLSQHLGYEQTVDVLVEFLRTTVERLKIEKFTLITDFGFSQVSIKFSYQFPHFINGILFIYTPMIVPEIIKDSNRRILFPFFKLYAKTRMFDWALDKLRNSDRVMHKMFLRNENPEAIELELIDIENKRKAHLPSIFESAWSFLNTNVEHEWRNLECKMEVVVAEKDEILDTNVGISYLKTNPLANIIIVKNHNHNWDNNFINVMRERLMKII